MLAEITVFDVWHKILDGRPEVVKQCAKVYGVSQHGMPSAQEVEVLPRERILWSDTALQFYGQPREIKAIGAQVEVRPINFDRNIDYSGAYRFFCDGESLEINRQKSKSFIFVDFESQPGPELLSLAIKTLNEWKSDWYLFDSGGSFHLVIDKLVELKDIPKYYGQLIMDMAKNMSPTKSKLYGHVGKYLIDNADNMPKLKLWIDSVLEKFGHVDEGSANGKLVFPIDMRYIAHVLDGTVNGTIDEGYLRVSEKHGSVPVLIAQQVNGQIKTYEFDDNLFHRLQPRLPKF